MLFAGVARLASVEAIGALGAILGEQRKRDRFCEDHLADDAVAAGGLALAAGVFADGESLQADGKAPFQNLRVGDSRVGHVRVHGVRAVEARPGSGAAADGFVVAAALVAEDQVVHRPLAGGDDPKRLKQQIHQPLTRLDVAADHGWRLSGVVGKLGIEQATGKGDLDVLHQPLVEWHRFVDEQPDDVDHRALDNRRRGVEVAAVQGVGAREIDADFSVANLDRGFELRAVVQSFGGGVPSRLESGDAPSDSVGCPLPYLPHVVGDCSSAVRRGQPL